VSHPALHVVPFPHHAERVRTHRAPRRGFLSEATSPRSSALFGLTTQLNS